MKNGHDQEQAYQRITEPDFLSRVYDRAITLYSDMALESGKGDLFLAKVYARAILDILSTDGFKTKKED